MRRFRLVPKATIYTEPNADVTVNADILDLINYGTDSALVTIVENSSVITVPPGESVKIGGKVGDFIKGNIEIAFSGANRNLHVIETVRVSNS